MLLRLWNNLSKTYFSLLNLLGYIIECFLFMNLLKINQRWLPNSYFDKRIRFLFCFNFKSLICMFSSYSITTKRFSRLSLNSVWIHLVNFPNFEVRLSIHHFRLKRTTFFLQIVVTVFDNFQLHNLDGGWSYEKEDELMS